MKNFKLLPVIMLTVLLACEKEKQEPDYIRLSNPDEVIADVSPENNAMDIGIDTSLLIQFTSLTYKGYTGTVGTHKQMIAIDTVMLYTGNEYIGYNGKFVELDKYEITPKESLERGTVYTLYFKVHYVLWNGDEWIDNKPDGEIEYYEYNYTFQTALPAIISSYYPAEETDSLSVYLMPYVVFHFSSDSVIRFENSDQSFRLNTAYFTLTYDDQNIPGEIVTEGNWVLFHPFDWLPEGVTVKIEMKVNWQKLINDSWTNCIKLDNNEICETLEIYFKINDADFFFINEKLIEAVYPVNRQYHFLQDEYEFGYMMFNMPMDNLFISETNGKTNDYKAIITENQTENKMVADVIYESSQKLAKYEMPENLKNETIYNLRLVRITESDTAMLYEYYFRTSMFDTWEAKFNAYNIPGSFVCGGWPYYFGQTLESGIDVRDKAVEGLDGVESQKGQYNAGTGLVRMDMLFENNDFFDSFINPNIYEPWTVEGFTPVLTRPEEPYGIPPLHSGLIICGEAGMLKDENIETNTANPLSLDVLVMEVFTKHFIYYDIIDIQNQIKQHFTQEQINADARLSTIVGFGPRKYYEAGDYHIQIYYQIPGLNVVTTDPGEYIMKYIIL